MTTLDGARDGVVAGSGAGRTVLASDRLDLGSPDAAWFVDSGAVRVFAVELLDGEPVGQLHPLFTSGAGSVLVGSGRLGLPFRLIAVGVTTDTVVRPILTRTLAAMAADPVSGAVVGSAVERWVANLAESAAGNRVDPDRPRVRVGPGEQVASAAGDVISPRAGRTVWLPIGTGRIVTAWDHPLEGTVPLTPHVAVQVAEDCVLSPVTAAQALAGADGWAGVRALLSACLEVLADHVAAVRQSEIDRQDILDSYEDDLETAVFTDLGGLLTGDPTNRVSAVGGSPVVAAARVVGAAAGITVVEPAAGLLAAAQDPLEVVARQSGFRVRRVALTKGWYRQDAGPLLARLEGDNGWVALVPAGSRRYQLVSPATGERRRVDAALAGTLAFEAVQLYRPLPPGRVTGRDLLRFALRDVGRDVWRVVASGVAIGLLALLPTFAAQSLFSTVIPHGDRVQLLWIVAVVSAGVLASGLLGLYQGILSLRVETRATTGVQAAVFARTLELPSDFYRNFSSADLAVRSMGIETLRETLSQYTVTTVLATFAGLCNVGVMFYLQPVLALFGLGALAIGVGVTVVAFRVMSRRQRLAQDAQGALFAAGVQMLAAVSKLRVAHAERRAFARWAQQFGEMKRYEMRSSRASGMLVTFFAAFVPLSSAIMLLGAAAQPSGSLSSGDFIAFNTAFTQAVASLIAISASLYLIAAVAPLYHRMRPILDAEPETSAAMPDPGTLRGGVEVDNVSFRYRADGPLVLDDVSFSARPGEMVALVGASGSGKSSLLRLLLGFAAPETGSVSFDGQDLAGVDVRAVRRQCGVVIQGTRLMPGDIRYNIAGTRRMTKKQVWDAAKLADAEQFIKDLPMHLQTVVSEQGGAFSGGQKQKLLLARAMAGRPRILLLDEATSALDNRSQAAVMRNVEELDATRIVIAHRLSTIRRADRIVVLAGGRVVQQGTYAELSTVDGPFSELVRRQTL